MSYTPAPEPRCEESAGLVERIIEPREKDLGGFSVRRVLPYRSRKMVGPFIFFDHFGPAVFPPGEGIQVRPHPHIGIATVSYLFTGSFVHRDSLGYEQVIEPGAVNLMTAGRGIVHSERAGEDLPRESCLHGLQIWIALPDAAERCAPEFAHYPAAEIPEFATHGVRLRLVIGEWGEYRSPVTQHSPTLYAEAHLPEGGCLELPPLQRERAVYGVEGTVRIGSHTVGAGCMAVLAETGDAVRIEAPGGARVVVIGGEPVGRRHIWWNFVASRPGLIEQAKDDWQRGRFGRIEGDDEFIPLPD